MMGSDRYLGIQAASYHLPARRLTVEDWARTYDASPQRLDRLRQNGVRYYHDSDDRQTGEMAAEAIEGLLQKSGLAPRKVDLLVFAHTGIGALGPPLTSVTAPLKRQFGFSSAQTLSLGQQNCVSILTSIRIVTALAQQQKHIEHMIIVSSDQIRRSIGHVRAIGDLAMHTDASSALLLSTRCDRNRIASVSSFAEARDYLGQLDRVESNETFFLSAVFVMRRALQAAKLSGGDVLRVLPNHVNRPAWPRILQYLRIPSDRLFDTNFEKGHAFGSDWIINFVDSDSAAGPMLAFSNGLSGCFGAAVILS
jgi:3-oxoacyl-[acyl-carrier-protein] synthase-3